MPDRASNQEPGGTIGLFAAMESEVLACPEWTRNGERKALEGGATVIFGEGAFVCQTGVGRERTLAAVEAALSAAAPAVVLSVGIAGGLSPGLKVGDLVVCTHVDHESHRHSGEEQSVYPDEHLLTVALSSGPEGVVTGTSLTVDEPAWGPAEKAAQHAWKAHDIVEMESFWIVAAATRRGLPTLTVRAVSDASQHSIPNTGAIRPDGTLDQEKFLAYLREHPETGARVSELAQNARVALDSLAAFLEAFLPRLGSRAP